MSLFRVRDFWSFDLDQLQQHTDHSQPPIKSSDIEQQQRHQEQQKHHTIHHDHRPSSTTNQEKCTDAHFLLSLGRFQTIGDQDVFVCGNLDGLIYVVQVPLRSQQAKFNQQTIGDDDKTTTKDNDADLSTDRQLLAACGLNLPIIDLKCGYFNSALKQTIAVLTFGKLIVFQVKRRQVDLLSGGESALIDLDGQQSQTINENLLSHELEEHYRIDLLADEFASSILVLDSHADSCLTTQSSNHQEASGSSNNYDSTAREQQLSNSKQSTGSFVQKSKQIVQQLHLPQRDKIIVQYTNQFMFTLIESKKITGHYYIRPKLFDNLALKEQQEKNNNNNNMDTNQQDISDVAQFNGPMPMAYLYSSRSGSALVVTLSDYKIYCLPLEKLISQAKQNIMKRVAQNLLIDSRSTQLIDDDWNDDNSALSDHRNIALGQYNSTKSSQLAKVWVDLDSFVEWEYELFQAPIQLVGVQRRARDIISPSQQDDISLSQLLVMSRYCLDLFAFNGSHLWSLRFETPLMYIHCYTNDNVDRHSNPKEPQVPLEQGSNSSSASSRQKLQFTDQLVSLICTNSLNNETSNLIILQEDQFVWSALLNCKPIQLMRTNLNKMSGILVSLDNNQSQLTASYLGTNNNNENESTLTDEPAASANDVHLSKLSRLDEQFTTNMDEQQASIDFCSQQTSLLVVETKLEQAKSNQWPDISIECLMSIWPHASSTSVLHNMILTLEFDDLLRFDVATDEGQDELASESNLQSRQRQQQQQVVNISKGIVQASLGNCWPDRREPIQFKGSFSLFSSKRLRGTNAIDQLDNDINQIQKTNHEQQLLPKCLKVNVIIRFNESRFGQLIQEQSFLLPLNIISQLTHLDFSSGQGQDLNDVLNNLNNSYKRLSDVQQTSPSPYYVCDLFLKVNADLLDLVDDIIESDLICRGQNSESSLSSDKNRLSGKEKKLTTLENINLLAQSLDCRLRYKSPTLPSGQHGPEMARQESEEFVQPVIISIALKVNQTSSIFNANNQNTNETVVWIHICDLSTRDSNIPQDLVKLHAGEWKKYSISRTIKQDDHKNRSNNTNNSQDDEQQQQANSILISIECDQPLPVLFYQTHLIERLKRAQTPDKLNLDLMAVVANDISSDIDHQTLLKRGNFTAISSNLHDQLKLTLTEYNEKLKGEFKRLKDELSLEYSKFRIATMTSLSLAKKLHNLPENIGRQQFHSLSALTKQYQLNLNRILSELERLQKLDYEFSKIPSATNIKIEAGDARDGSYKEWPNFSQIIN